MRLRASHRDRAQISPALCTSQAPPNSRPSGLGAIPPLMESVVSSTSAQVRGLTVLSVLYGKRRTP